MTVFIRPIKLKSSDTSYYVIVKHNGRQKSYGGFRRKKDAEARKRQIISRIAAGTFLFGHEEPANPIDLILFDIYKRWIGIKENTCKPATTRGYRLHWKTRILPDFGQLPANGLTPVMIQDWVNELADSDLAPDTVKGMYRAFRACVLHSYRQGLIDTNPFRGIELPRSERGELLFLTPAQILALLEEMGVSDRVLFSILAWAGLRFGEGLGLAWRHVDLKTGSIVVTRSWSSLFGFLDPKTPASRRNVPILPDLSRTLREYYLRTGRPSPDELLFSFDGKRPFDQSSARRRFVKALETAGLPRVTVHSLRHSFASLMIASGASIKTLQKALGHASATLTLDTYGHLMKDDMTEAAERANATLRAARESQAETGR